jgi:hypothetical protein
MTLTEKIEQARTDSAWIKDYACSVEQMRRMGYRSVMDGVRWFESDNVVDLVALREILRKEQGAV